MASEPEPDSTTAAAAPLNPEPQSSAVLRCSAAWERTFELASLLPKKERKRAEFDSFATDQACEAFRNAMPPLTSYRNIQDQIACIGYAMLHGIFSDDECENLLQCAKVALAALRAQPPAATRSSTRSPAVSPAPEDLPSLAAVSAAPKGQNQ